MIDIDECRLRNGDLAFALKPAPEPPPIPAWYSAPAGSVRRGSMEQRFFGNSFLDAFSSRASEDAILAFYESCTAQGGLVRSAAPPVGRAVLAARGATPEIPGILIERATATTCHSVAAWNFPTALTSF